MFMTLLSILLGALVLYAICWPRREGLTSDESDATKVLAQKNGTNLADLKTKMDSLLKMSDQVDNIQMACDANTKNISTMVESCK